MGEGLDNAVIKVQSDQATLLDEPRAGSVRVSVKDSGAGLSPEQLGQICSEGVQFNANQLQAGGGSGLGLFISKGMVEAHGGTLTVGSEGLGKGATFSMELPLFRFEEDLSMQFDSIRAKPMASPRALFGSGSSKSNARIVPLSSRKLSNATKDSRNPSLSLGPRRVLVVDDADSNRKLLMRILKAKGYTCEGAANGQEACNVFEDLQVRGEVVDAVLMDYEMPVLNGPDATEKLRQLGCAALIIGVTGNVLPTDIDLFKSKGANTVLAKPLNIEAFESYLRAFRATKKVASAPPQEAQVKVPHATLVTVSHKEALVMEEIV
jgi:CheY-like chemotaxis protein